MAATLYLRSIAPALWHQTTPVWTLKDASRGVTPGATLLEGTDNPVKGLSTTIGTGTGSTAVTNTVAGTTLGLTTTSETSPTPWFSEPLAADVTISGTVSFDIYAHESSMNANATCRVALYRVNEQGALTLIVDSSFGTEVGTAKALKSWTASPTSTAMKRGDRFLAFIMWDDATALTMATGFTCTLTYDGSNANAADSRISFAETPTFITADPSGTSYWLRDTASDISGGKALSTSQGSGTAEAVHTTLAGALTFPGDQWTLTAGGSDAEWFTPALDAFTLQDVVLAEVCNNTAVLEAIGTPFDSLTLEIAVVDADGTNPVIWARSYTSTTATDNPRKHYLTGPAQSVAQGKRLRLRFFSDDFRPAGNQASGTSRTIRYDGTSTYATRLIFTQTITEAATGTTASPGTGLLIATGFPPAIQLPVLVTAGLGVLTATGFAASVVIGVTVSPALGELTATGFAPTVTASNNTTASPDVGSLVATGFAPTVTATNHITVATDVGVGTLTGLAPTVTASDHITVTAGLGAATLTGFAPTVTGGQGLTITPGLGETVLTGFSPTVTTSDHITVTAGLGTASLTGFAPTIQTPTAVTAGLGALSLTGFSPTVTAPAVVSAGLGQLTATGFAPTVTAGGSVTVTPGLGELLATGFTPSVALGGNQTVTPGVGILTATGFAPTVLTPVLVTAGVGVGSLTGFEPTVSTTSNVIAFTDTGSLALAGFAPAVSVTEDLLAEPGTGLAILTGYAPIILASPPPGTGHGRPVATASIKEGNATDISRVPQVTVLFGD